MDLREYPLLNEPNLMLRLLRLGRGPGASLDEAAARLMDDLQRINEPLPVGDAAVRGWLETAWDRLLIAGAIETGPEDGAYATTALGARVLDENPMGVDETVLSSLPGYRSFLDRKARRSRSGVGHQPAGDDPHLPEYDQGYAAFLANRALDDNPHDADSVLHLAWENGWTEARDEACGRNLDR